jgi:hypothetical protein
MKRRSNSVFESVGSADDRNELFCCCFSLNARHNQILGLCTALKCYCLQCTHPTRTDSESTLILSERPFSKYLNIICRYRRGTHIFKLR